jgi:hypothetical protein
VADNWQRKNLARAVQTARTFSQVSHKLGIIVPGLLPRFP